MFCLLFAGASSSVLCLSVTAPCIIKLISLPETTGTIHAYFMGKLTWNLHCKVKHAPHLVPESRLSVDLGLGRWLVSVLFSCQSKATANARRYSWWVMKEQGGEGLWLGNWSNPMTVATDQESEEATLCPWWNSSLPSAAQNTQNKTLVWKREAELLKVKIQLLPLVCFSTSWICFSVFPGIFLVDCLSIQLT